MGLVDGDLYLLDARFRQASLRQPLRQRLDQPHRRPAGQPHQPVGDGAIVDGKGKIVVGGRGPRIQPQNGVDDELLAVAALVLANTMPREHAQPFQRDPVQAHVTAPAASRQACPTRTASALARTSWTRTHHAPAAAASAVTATVASSLSANGRAEPSGPASSLPRNRLREAPMMTGKAGQPPRRETSARWVSSAQLCSASLANPRPGSTMICSGSTPAATTASTRRSSSSRTSPTTSRYTARSCMWSLCPRQCMTT